MKLMPIETRNIFSPADCRRELESVRRAVAQTILAAHSRKPYPKGQPVPDLVALYRREEELIVRLHQMGVLPNVPAAQQQGVTP